MLAATSQSISLALHAAAVALLLLLSSSAFQRVYPPAAHDIVRAVLLSPPRLKPPAAANDRGGGSNDSAAPPRRGELPQRGPRTFVPPLTHPDPKLPITPAILFDSPSVQTNLAPIGDPFSGLRNGMFGNGGGNGIGPRGCCGAGDGDGGPGFSPGRSSEPIRPAKVIYQPEPEFSEQARKAKFQGYVVLMIEIGTDGLAHNLRIVESPGLGLEEKAIEAVQRWRFRPAMRGNTPILSTARVEVFFHIF